MSAASVPLPGPPLSPCLPRPQPLATTRVMQPSSASVAGPAARWLPARRGALPPGFRWKRLLPDDLVAGEELGDLDRGRGRRVRPVHRVLADRLRMHLADGAGRCLGRIRRAHDLAI